MAAVKLNPIQRRHLHDSLAHLDRQLSAIAALLAPPPAGTLFARHHDDLSDAERRQQQAAVARVRVALGRALEAHAITPEPAAAGVRQALQSQWSLAEIGLEEMAPRSMRGYGALDEDQAQALEQLVAGLQAELQAALPGRTAARIEAAPEALVEALGDATPAAMAAMAAALAEAVEAGRSNDELPLVAGDALAQVARQVFAAAGRTPPAGAPDIDGIRWRLDKPRLAGLGRDYLRGRFERQLAPLEAQVRAALRAYGVKHG